MIAKLPFTKARLLQPIIETRLMQVTNTQDMYDSVESHVT